MNQLNTNLEYYKYFYYTAKYKSLTKAAYTLNSNQPNASRIIKLLENDLGITLFNRSKKGMELTPEGLQLYSHIKIAMEQVIEGETTAMTLKNNSDNIIHIAVSGSAMHYILPILERFKTNNTDIEIKFSCHLFRDAIERVRNEQSDFALVITDNKSAIPLKTTQLAEIKTVLTTGPTYCSYAEGTHSIKDLQHVPLIGLSDVSSSYDFFSDFYHKYGMTYEPNIITETTDQVILCIMYGLGIGFIPEISLIECQKTANLSPINLVEKIPARSLYLVEKIGHNSSTASKNLIEYIHNSASRMAVI